VLVYAFLAGIDPPEGEGGMYASAVLLLAVAAIAYAAELLIGTPGFFLSRRAGWLNSLTVVGGAAAVGVLVALMMDLPDLNLARWHYYAACTAAGASSGALFSAIAKPALKISRPVVAV
jgi:hypothetical protein